MRQSVSAPILIGFIILLLVVVCGFAYRFLIAPSSESNPANSGKSAARHGRTTPGQTGATP